MMSPEPKTADALFGVPAIAAHMQLKEAAVRHLIRFCGLPSFKVGGRVCARKSSIATWLAEREAAAQRARAEG